MMKSHIIRILLGSELTALIVQIGNLSSQIEMGLLSVLPYICGPGKVSFTFVLIEITHSILDRQIF